MSRATEQRIRELAADLAPVKPVPRLRWLAVAAATLWLAVAGFEWALGAPGPRGDGAWREPGFLAVLGGLAAVAAGAVVAALASSVPGRERLGRLGWGLVALGAVGLGGYGVSAALSSGAAGTEPFAMPWFCVGRTVWLGALPALVLLVSAARAFAARSARTALAACLGALALGALTVQLSCRADGVLHVLIGHAAAPALLAALLAIPCALWLRRSLRS